MKGLLAMLLGIALGCSGGHHGKTPTGAAGLQETPGFAATRWVPSKATYALSTHNVKEAQQVIRDVVGSFGIPLGVTERDVARGLENLLGVDALSVDALRAIGVDPEGGFALFSDDIDPTLAVHLSAPDALPAFFDKLHTRGMVSQSVVVDGTEIFSSSLGGGGAISWIVQGDWLLVHLGFPGVHDDGKAWVAASTHRGTVTWLDTWQWVNRVGAKVATSPSLLGFLDLRALLAASVRGADAVACLQAFAPVERVGLAFGGNGGKVDGRITFELGTAAARVAAAVLPDPPGWMAVATSAPLAAQWNVDLGRVLGWLAPCAGVLDARRELAELRDTGVLSARAFVQSLDLASTSGVGAVSLDLSSTKQVVGLLDEIPLRSTLERDRTWSGVAGHHLGIPFGPTIDYVLDEHRALAAMGDGVIDAVLAPGRGQPTPLFQLDVTPSGLPRKVWEMLFHRFDLPQKMLGVFTSWHDGHLALTLDGTALVFEARGNRR